MFRIRFNDWLEEREIVYKSGLLKSLDPPCKSMDNDGDCEEWGEEHEHEISDSRTEGRSYRNFVVPEVCFYLPHSCDQWVIGGEKEVELLIKDLEAALLTIRAPGQQKPIGG